MEFDLKDLFLKGGGFMWPLLLLSVLSVAIILERSLFYFLHRYRLGAIISCVREKAALASSSDPLASFATAFTSDLAQGEIHCLNVSEREATRLISAHERGIRVLALVAAISPLIGLLGTVWGMVIAFSKIATLGETVTPADFADGIWTGLLTTVAGLLVAIPAMAMAKIFEARVDRLVRDLNTLTSHLRETFFSPS